MYKYTYLLTYLLNISRGNVKADEAETDVRVMEDNRRLRCGGFFNFVANLLLNMPVKEIWKSVNHSVAR